MKKKTVKNAAIILIWLVIWQIAALAIHNSIMFTGPVDVIKALLRNLLTKVFYLSVLHSFAMIFAGFLSALLLGSILAVISFKSRTFDDFLLPLMTAIKSVPVASFVVLLLIWFGSGTLSVYISLLIVLPNIYLPMLEGLKHHDEKFKMLADISHMSLIDRAKFLYWPAVYPYLITGLKTGIGMAFKSGVAAEVIGMSHYTLGERIYLSKINLETDNLLAWTLMVILLCYFFEKATLKVFNLLGQHHFASKGIRFRSVKTEEPIFNDVSKSYDQAFILKNLTIDFRQNKRHMLVAPSGIGKTTALNLLAGFIKEDSGSIHRVNTSIAFQEEVFLENYTALENLRILSGENFSEKEITDFFLQILPEDSLCKPVKEFSGGMKRRLSVLRALLSDASLLLLDEPFGGLDLDSKMILCKLINELSCNKFLVITGHYEEDADLLSAERTYLWKPE